MIFSSAITFRLSLRFMQAPVRWVPSALSQESEWLQRKSDNVLSAAAKLSNAWGLFLYISVTTV